MNEEMTNNTQMIAGAQMGQSQQQMLPQSTADAGQELQQLDEVLKHLFGADFSIVDKHSQELLVNYLLDNREQNERLAEALGRDPRMAQMLADMVEGKRNAHSAMARYFGRSFMNYDEGTPEYEEMLMADEERREELYRLAEDRKAYEDNLAQSMPVIQDFCTQRGYDPSDFLGAVWDRLIVPILSGSYTAAVCGALDNAINYEQDVEDAFAAGDVKGRNTSIRRMKGDFSDSMPTGMRSVAPEVVEKPRRTNTLIDTALEA
ncbi:MAG: hypothetical protein IJF46_08135 [Bacteroidaceae bacterium]|nr:hypothetical protein [Bacteroidaceae bacterium]